MKWLQVFFCILKWFGFVEMQICLMEESTVIQRLTQKIIQAFQMVDIQENAANKPIFIFQTMTSWYKITTGTECYRWQQIQTQYGNKPFTQINKFLTFFPEETS